MDDDDEPELALTRSDVLQARGQLDHVNGNGSTLTAAICSECNRPARPRLLTCSPECASHRQVRRRKEQERQRRRKAAQRPAALPAPFLPAQVQLAAPAPPGAAWEHL